MHRWPRRTSTTRAWAEEPCAARRALGKGWDGWLGIVEPQIEARTLVQRMEDAIQGDLRLIITGQQRERKGRHRLAQRESNQPGTRPLYASTHQDPVIALHLCTDYRHRVSSP